MLRPAWTIRGLGAACVRAGMWQESCSDFGRAPSILDNAPLGGRGSLPPRVSPEGKVVNFGGKVPDMVVASAAHRSAGSPSGRRGVLAALPPPLDLLRGRRRPETSAAPAALQGRRDQAGPAAHPPLTSDRQSGVVPANSASPATPDDQEGAVAGSAAPSIALSREGPAAPPAMGASPIPRRRPLHRIRGRASVRR